jgi:hypothetical protein
MKEEDINIIDLSDFPKQHPKPKDKKYYYNPIDAYTLEGVYINTYKSPASLSKELDIPSTAILACCKGRILFCYKIGRIFLYKGDNIEKRLKEIEESKKKHQSKQGYSVEVYTKKGKFLSCHRSIVAAAEKYNAAPSTIKDCCIGERLFVRDKIFLFLGDNIKQRVKDIKQKEELELLVEKELLNK